MQVKKLIANKYILYIVVFVSLANAIGYLTMRDYDSLIFFIVTALLSSYFSKNMTITLLTAILATNILFANNRLTEGMENKGKCVVREGEEDSSPTPCNSYTKEEECSGVCQWKSDTINKGVPASTPALLKKKDDDSAEGKDIDFQSTMSEAYSNLQNMLGEGGIQNLSKDTKELMTQQKELMKSFEGLGPMMDTAKDAIKSLQGMPDVGQLKGLVKSFTKKKKDDS